MIGAELRNTKCAEGSSPCDCFRKRAAVKQPGNDARTKCVPGSHRIDFDRRKAGDESALRLIRIPGTFVSSFKNNLRPAETKQFGKDRFWVVTACDDFALD